jgi:hypothetical protein
MKGLFWWDWPASPQPAGNSNYTARDKPAGDVIRNWYSPLVSA